MPGGLGEEGPENPAFSRVVTPAEASWQEGGCPIHCPALPLPALCPIRCSPLPHPLFASKALDFQVPDTSLCTFCLGIPASFEPLNACGFLRRSAEGRL